MRLSIIIPCYNEAETIGDLLSRVQAAALPEGWEREIIVVDDGSGPATRSLLTGLGMRDKIRVIFKEKNEGKGSALKAGFRAATGDYILIQDADLEYDPAEYSRLLAPLIAGEADAVFGSRVLGTNNVPFDAIYFYGGLMIARVFNLAFGTRFSDITTCYKVFGKGYVPELIAQPNQDFVFDAVELTHVLAAGRVVEVPISYSARSRSEGKKLNWRHGLKCLAGVVRLRYGAERYDRQMPAALRIFRFIVSGGTAAAVNAGLLYVLTAYAHIWYLYSDIASFIAAFIVSFCMQKFWTFRNRDDALMRRQLPVFLLVSLFNLFLNTGLVYLFVEHAHIWYVLSQLMASAIIAFESFFAFRKIFSRKRLA